MKKFLTIALIILLVICFAGCGTYQPPLILEDPDDTTQGTPGVKPPDSGTVEPEIIFTVTLYSEGRRFSPSTLFYAQWTSEDKTEIVNAPFDALGVAQTNKLDGEYRVTLSGLPDDYTYDPNGIYVDNDHRDVIIELLPILTTSHNGTNYYEDCIEVTQPGTFRHTFKSKTERCWFRYYPTAPGIYKFESWVDVTENEINPKMDHFYGNTQYVNEGYPDATYDEGGTSSTFSKNFRYGIELSQEYVGNVWIFKLYADCKGDYPINVDFTITYIGEYVDTENIFEKVEANGPFRKVDPAGNWTYNYADNDKILDSTRFRLYWVDTNLNGVYDSEYVDLNLNGKFDEGDEWQDINGNGKYDPSADQWWDVNDNGRFDLGIDIWIDNGNGRPECDGDPWLDTNGNGVFDEGDPWYDENGNGVCDHDLGDGFYHEYDEVKYADNDGWGPILFAKLNKDIEAMNYGDTGGHFANVNIRLRFDGKDYVSFMNKYFSYCNREGAHPVTQELKDFLQHYATSQSMFCDGESLAERIYGLIAGEEDMWLFACGYYK